MARQLRDRQIQVDLPVTGSEREAFLLWTNSSEKGEGERLSLRKDAISMLEKSIGGSGREAAHGSIMTCTLRKWKGAVAREEGDWAAREIRIPSGEEPGRNLRSGKCPLVRCRHNRSRDLGSLRHGRTRTRRAEGADGEARPHVRALWHGGRPPERGVHGRLGSMVRLLPRASCSISLASRSDTGRSEAAEPENQPRRNGAAVSLWKLRLHVESLLVLWPGPKDHHRPEGAPRRTLDAGRTHARRFGPGPPERQPWADAQSTCLPKRPGSPFSRGAADRAYHVRT